jgi:exosortase A-associated hydrolase 2
MPIATLDPFFLDSPNGRLFAVHHRPVDAALTRGHVLCVPAFNEEMNRCRSMVALQAQAFARLGIGTLVIDLLGTGDSAGNYVDARWNNWLDNIRAGMNWLNEQPGGFRGFLGVRLGAIFAAEALNKLSAPNAALILWQPVVDGKQHFTQFLRMRIAAQMERPHLPKETTNSMREQLAAGQSLEVSGYEIHPEFAAALDAARLDAFLPKKDSPVLWLEQAASDAAQASPASQKVIDAWQAGGASIDIKFFEGPNFWQVAERAISTSAIDATTAWAKQTWVAA